MDLAHQHQLMLKILIGSAWVDRHLEPEEVTYLNSVLKRFHLEGDRDLQALLKTPVPPEQTERWLVAYLRDTPDSERLKLLAAIGNLLISDHVVSAVEHDLLDEFHDLMASLPAPRESSEFHHGPKLLEKIGQFFRRVMQIG
ncbi:MAG: TerB family tellurite resistance protein [Thermosynechococcaceae cyanobacterium MS004]|nr:TerB family tellurite resistance protein [Thermosynechococcaceae cyanobacterium MS004]